MVTGCDFYCAATQKRKCRNTRQILFVLHRETYSRFFLLSAQSLSFLRGLASQAIVFHQSLLIRHLQWFMALSPELVSCLISHSLHRQTEINKNGRQEKNVNEGMNRKADASSFSIFRRGEKEIMQNGISWIVAKRSLLYPCFHHNNNNALEKKPKLHPSDSAW